MSGIGHQPGHCLTTAECRLTSGCFVGGLPVVPFTALQTAQRGSLIHLPWTTIPGGGRASRLSECASGCFRVDALVHHLRRDSSAWLPPTPGELRSSPPQGRLELGGWVRESGVWLGPTPPPPLCDIPSGCCSFTGQWTVTRSSLRMLRRVAAFCRPLRPVLPLVSFLRSRSPVVGVPGLC